MLTVDSRDVQMSQWPGNITLLFVCNHAVHNTDEVVVNITKCKSQIMTNGDKDATQMTRTDHLKSQGERLHRRVGQWNFG